MRKLLAAVRGLLIHDMDEDAFADMYAQTVAYGLLSARFSRPAGLTAQNLVQLTSVSNPFLENLLENLFRLNRGKFHFDVDEVGINDVLDLLRKTNIEAIKAAFNDQNPAEDPVIRFYEGFLKEYDPKQRIRRGIFFTPRPVVSYIVRSVHELLQAEFGLEEGLASTVTWGEMIKKFPNMKLPESVKPDESFVSILDPATGTGTFLFTCIEVIERTMKDKWCREVGKKSWNDPEILVRWREYVPRYLLPRLYGYELMMAPYAIAHLKLALKLGETGYQFRDGDRLHIYLTNILEPPSEVADPKLADLFATLAKEAQEVNDIKRHKRFTVIVGNPPYAGESMNKGEWIRSLIDEYMYVEGKHLNEKGKKNWLQDDYVKFIRFSQWAIKETGVGIVGLITNHSYLDNPTFRGMRASLAGTFRSLRLCDLHGNSKKKEQCPDGSTDENVFDILMGVAIGFFLLSHRHSTPSIDHSEIWGLRNLSDASHAKTGKYEWLAGHTVNSTTWRTVVPANPFFLFTPQDADIRSEYEIAWKITEALPHSGAGIITSRDHFVIDFEDAPIRQRLDIFRNPDFTDEWVQQHLQINDNSMWSMAAARKDFRLKPLDDSLFVDCLYRPLDTRRIYFETNVVFNMRVQVMRHMLAGRNMGLAVGRAGQVIDQGQWNIVFCTSHITEFNLFRRGGNTLIPLYLVPEKRVAQGTLGNEDDRRPNLSPPFLKDLAAKLKLPQSGFHNLPQDLTPEEIFHYTYAVLHSPGYRSRYAEFLKIDFPRLPLTTSLELFRALAKLGGELVALHLLESPKLENLITRFVDNAQNEIEKVSYARETVWLDKAQTTGFAGVPEAVWNFHIGGYQVCEKWLKDRRGRKLSKEDITHYHRIVVALKETIRLMPEIDEVINKHGGWPGAFASTSYNEPPESEMPLAAEASASYGKGEPEK